MSCSPALAARCTAFYGLALDACRLFLCRRGAGGALDAWRVGRRASLVVMLALPGKSLAADLEQDHVDRHRPRELVGMPPYEFSRHLRFKAARAALKKRSKSDRIRDIATAHGFVQQGRFARDYRQLFGELPSETRSRR